MDIQQTLFKIAQMDCTAEENLVRMKLETIAAIKALEFDLAQRRLTVFHEGEIAPIEQALASLNLGSTLIETIRSTETLPQQINQRNILWAVLLINAAFFLIESTAGLVSNSMGLVADSLDMLADALVYGLSLVSVGATTARKRHLARWSGYFQLSLAAFGLIELLRRFLGLESLPDFRVMVVVSLFALTANAICLYLLQRAKSGEIHMKASLIFTSNDIIVNLGVITAGLLVNWLDTGLPDLIVGTLVFAIVVRGALRILNLADA